MTFYLITSCFLVNKGGDKVFAPFGGNQWFWTVDISSDGRYVITGNDVGEVALWDYQTGNQLWFSSRQESFVMNIFFSPDSQSAFSVVFGGVPVQWQIDEMSLAELMTWTGQNRYLRDFTCNERATYRIEPLCDADSK